MPQLGVVTSEKNLSELNSYDRPESILGHEENLEGAARDRLGKALGAISQRKLKSTADRYVLRHTLALPLARYDGSSKSAP